MTAHLPELQQSTRMTALGIPEAAKDLYQALGKENVKKILTGEITPKDLNNDNFAVKNQGKDQEPQVRRGLGR